MEFRLYCIPMNADESPQSKNQLSSWRVWLVRTSCFWSPLLFAFLVNAVIKWRVHAWLPEYAASAPPLWQYLVVDMVIALVLTVPSAIILAYVWCARPDKLEHARKWSVGIQSFCIVVVFAFLCLVEIKLAAVYYLNAGDFQRTNKICSIVERLTKFWAEGRSTWFMEFAHDAAKTGQGPIYLEQILKLELQVKNPNQQHLAALNRDLARAYATKGDPKTAVFYAKQCLHAEELQKKTNVDELVSDMSELARHLYDSKDMVAAEQVVKRALPYANKCNDRSRINLLQQAGAIYHGLGQREYADSFYRKLLPDAQKNKEQTGPRIWMQIGLSAANQGNLAEAERCLRKCIDLNRSLPGHTAEYFAALADILAAEGKFSEAEEMYKTHLQTYYEEPNALIGLACLYDKQRHYEKADYLYRVAEQLEVKRQQGNILESPRDSQLKLVLSADRLKRMLSLMPAKELKALKERVDYIGSNDPGGKRDFTDARKFITLSLTPVAIDLRALNNQCAGGSGAEPSTCIESEVLAECLSKVERAKIVSTFKWGKLWLGNVDRTLKAAATCQPLPGTVLKPVIYQDLMPMQYAVISDKDLQSLLSLAGLSEASMVRMRNRYRVDTYDKTHGLTINHSKQFEAEFVDQLEFVEETFGTESIPAIQALNEVGEFYFDVGKYGKAKKYYQKTFDRAEDLHGRYEGELNALFGRIGNNLWWLYQTTGDKKNSELCKDSRAFHRVLLDYRKAPRGPLEPALPASMEGFVPRCKFAGDRTGSLIGGMQETPSVLNPVLIDSTKGMPPGQVFEDEFCDDARIIQGVSTAGTVVLAMPAKRALEQIPKEQALKEFRYAKDLRLFESPTVDLTQTLLILDLLPVVRDFRKPLSAGSVKSTNGAGKDVGDTGAAIVSGELMRACLAKLTSDQLKKYSEFKNWYPGASQLIPERIPEPSPGQIEFPRSVRDLMPKEVLILTNGVWRDLKHDSGMTDEELDKIRKHSGLQCPAQLSPPGRS